VSADVRGRPAQLADETLVPNRSGWSEPEWEAAAWGPWPKGTC